MTRTGIGYDVHLLRHGEKLILGGVEIPFERGSVGHSDGDVLCHAIVDALLGAASLGDIGQHFPSGNDRWKGASSLDFVQFAGEIVGQQGFEISNVDCTVVLQKPNLTGYIDQMKSKISDALNIGVAQVSVKATTTDSLGFVGRGEGISALAIATITEAHSD